MKVGVSTYSLYGAIEKGEMDVLAIIDWIGANGGEHVEIVPFGFALETNRELDEVKKRAAAAGLEISSYTIEAQLLQPTEKEFQAEVDRLKKEVDKAHRLGVKLMRHDVASREPEEATIQNFMKDLPKLVEGCQAVADHAAQYGITTSVENHGYHCQHSDRVQLLVSSVDRPNYKTTIDTGNFVCVDEDPIFAVRKNLPIASMVHVKDFYRRPAEENPGEGWFPSSNGTHLRGAIFGQGDLDVRKILHEVKKSGYDGYISLEFEGMEECREACKIGMDN
ncbi:MAG: sugar phosphate isomerase/epimerase, partial [Candidatus Omnitrophica bacterium]|nr:sugar phosphate isomerase/epimerase [Candidatus Omnitrophota bacterium]